MLARIAREVEQYLPGSWFRERLRAHAASEEAALTDTLSLAIETAVERLSPSLVMIPTRSGFTARQVARYRLPTWIVALCTQPETARQLHFSGGVHPVLVQDEPDDWREFIGRFMDEHGIPGHLAVFVAGPSEKNPNANYRMELIELRR